MRAGERAIFLREWLNGASQGGNASSQMQDIAPLAPRGGPCVIVPASRFQRQGWEADMTNAEDKLREWQVLYREWTELEHRLQSPVGPDGGATAAELKMRARSLQQQCASALAALDSAVNAMRQRRERREKIS